MSSPFFTIGVTTYNRRELLRQTLSSLLAQSFSDFEIIVGNDYTQEILSPDIFGITDQRIRFINHPQNLQEVGNMNSLLNLATGRYFSWLADDDLYHPDFLQICHNSIIANNYPPAVFSSYRIFQSNQIPAMQMIPAWRDTLFTGSEFLESYFKNRIKIIGVYGLFQTATLKSIVGGVEQLCESAVGLYGEYIFLVRCALFERIAYVDAPLILYRGHTSSWSASNAELDKYVIAGKELIKRCSNVLRHDSLSDNFDYFLISLCKIHLISFAGKTATHVIICNNYSFGLVSRAYQMFSDESRLIRQEFILLAGSMKLSSLVSFIWMYLRSYYIISGMIGLNWCKKILGDVLVPKQDG